MSQHKRICAVCEADISDKHANRKFCSSKCANKDRYRRTGQRSTSEQRAKWYNNRKLKPGHIEKLREQDSKRSREIKDFLANYKLSKGCSDCGYSGHRSALDFDHVNGIKEINVCNAKSIAQALEEIKKCEVVCANCHRVRTYNRLYPCKPDIFEKTYEFVAK